MQPLQANIFYYYVYGEEEYYKQCIYSLLSLRNIGKYNGVVYIYTENSKIIEFYLEKANLKNNVIIKELTYKRPLFCRYIAAIDLIDNLNFNKAIYLDNDIIISKNLNQFLSFYEESDIYVYRENPPAHLLSYFYITSNKKEKEYLKDNTLLVNSGLFIFTKNMKSLFIDVLEKEKTYDEEQYNLTGDQPVFVSSLSTINNINTSYLLMYEKLHNNIENNFNTLTFTFYHFNIGFKLKNKGVFLVNYLNRLDSSLNNLLWFILSNNYK